jgi:hypothetical protein
MSKNALYTAVCKLTPESQINSTPIVGILVHKNNRTFTLYAVRDSTSALFCIDEYDPTSAESLPRLVTRFHVADIPADRHDEIEPLLQSVQICKDWDSYGWVKAVFEAMVKANLISTEEKVTADARLLYTDEITPTISELGQDKGF